jgi:hypothetical protein
MTYPTVKNVPLDQIFDPYISGTKAAITGYTVKVAGVNTDLKDLFAPRYLGSSAAVTNYRVNGADLNTIFAAKGTASYALPIDGNSFGANRTTRGTASLTWTMKSDGTYSVVRDVGGGLVVLASGTWLPSGGAVSGYKCTFSYSVNSAGTIGSGSNSVTNDAPTSASLSTTRNFVNSSTSILVTDRADQAVTVTMKLYTTGGTLLSTTTVTLSCVGDGN